MSFVSADRTGSNKQWVDDWDLVHRCQEGDRSAFDLIIRRHYQLIINICFRILLDKSLAQEAAQDIFLKAYERIESVRKEDKPYIHLLCRIATNHSKNLYRRKKLETRIFVPTFIEEQAVSPDQECAFTALVAKESINKVNKAISELKQSERIPFVLTHVAQLSVEEIGSIMRLPQYTVRRRIHTALEKVKSALRNEELLNAYAK